MSKNARFTVMRTFPYFVWLFFPLLSLAQSEGTTWGIKGGLNRSAINGREHSGARTGFVGVEIYGAIFLDTRLADQWRFGTELLFSYTDDYHFAEIPLHFKRSVHKNIFVFTGAKLDILVDPDDDIYDFNHFGASIDLGGEYHFTRHFFSEVRYSKGLIKQVNDRALEILGGRRNTLRVGIGVRF